MKKLAIITTHPIQYNAPLFKLLHQRNRVESRVFYTWGDSVLQHKYDLGFKKEIAWDIPLLEGYDAEFVHNTASDPGSHHFNGINTPGLVATLEQWAPDVLLVFGWSFKSHLKVLRHFKGRVRILFRGDSTLLDATAGGSLRKILRWAWLQWVYRHVDVALYVGTANRAYFLQYGLRSKQLVFAPHAVDNTRFAERHYLAIEKELPNDAIVFLFAGKFGRKKNPLMLLEAFFLLNDVNSFLLMTGNGELEEVMMTRLAQQPEQLRSRIRFIPFQNQTAMPGVYQLADVFVLPSQGPGETWGLAVNEAMACGLPVIVSNRCGCAADLVKEGVNGHVFTSGNITDLVSKMQSCLQVGKQGLKQQGAISAQIINHWTLEMVAAPIEELVITT